MKLTEYLLLLVCGLILLIIPKYLPIILKSVYRFFNYEKILKTFVIEEFNTDHRFIEVKRDSSEMLSSEKLPYKLYVGVEPILMDVRKLPIPSIRRLGYIKVFFHRFGEPFVRTKPSEGSYLDIKKKNNTLIERGKYQIIKDQLTTEERLKTIMKGWPMYITSENLSLEDSQRTIIHPQTKQQLLPCQITDIDFLRDDYGTQTLDEMYVKFIKASEGGWSFHSFNMIIIYALVTCVVFGFFMFNGLDFITEIMRMIMALEF